MGRKDPLSPPSPSNLFPKTPSPVPASRPDTLSHSMPSKDSDTLVPRTLSRTHPSSYNTADEQSSLSITVSPQYTDPVSHAQELTVRTDSQHTTPLSQATTPTVSAVPVSHSSTSHSPSKRTLTFNSSSNFANFLPAAPSRPQRSPFFLSFMYAFLTGIMPTNQTSSSSESPSSRSSSTSSRKRSNAKSPSGVHEKRYQGGGRGQGSRSRFGVHLTGGIRWSLLLLLCTLCAMVFLQITTHHVHYRHPHHSLPSTHTTHLHLYQTHAGLLSQHAGERHAGDSHGTDATNGNAPRHMREAKTEGDVGITASRGPWSWLLLGLGYVGQYAKGALQYAGSIFVPSGHHGSSPATLSAANRYDTASLGTGREAEVLGHGVFRDTVLPAMAKHVKGRYQVPEVDAALQVGKDMVNKDGEVVANGWRAEREEYGILPNSVELAGLQEQLNAALVKVGKAAADIEQLVTAGAHVAPVAQQRNGSYVAMCVVTKNSHHDVCEWLRYHHYVLGVEQFYFNDDGSDEPLMKSIKGCIPMEYVEYRYIHTEMLKGGRGSTNSPQMYAYNHCILRGMGLHQWIAFVDIDEFITIQQPMKLAAFLRQYERYGALGLTWRVFGSSGHVNRTAHGVLASYSACLPVDHNQNKHVKTIGNMDYVVAMNHPHVPVLRQGAIMVDVHKRPTTYAFAQYATYDIAFLAHYVLKSRQEYQEKIDRGSAMKKYKTWLYFNSTDAKTKTQCTWGRAISKCVDHLATLEGGAQNCYCNISYTAYRTCVEPETHVKGFCRAAGPHVDQGRIAGRAADSKGLGQRDINTQKARVLLSEQHLASGAAGQHVRNKGYETRANNPGVTITGVGVGVGVGEHGGREADWQDKMEGGRDAAAHDADWDADTQAHQDVDQRADLAADRDADKDADKDRGWAHGPTGKEDAGRTKDEGTMDDVGMVRRLMAQTAKRVKLVHRIVRRHPTGSRRRRRATTREVEIRDNSDDADMLDADVAAKHAEIEGMGNPRASSEGEDYDSHVFEDERDAAGAGQRLAGTNRHGVVRERPGGISTGHELGSAAAGQREGEVNGLWKMLFGNHMATTKFDIGRNVRESHPAVDQQQAVSEVRGAVSSTGGTSHDGTGRSEVQGSTTVYWEVELKDLPVPACNLPPLEEGEDIIEKDGEAVQLEKERQEAEQEKREKLEARREAEKAWAEEEREGEDDGAEQTEGERGEDEAQAEEHEGGEKEEDVDDGQQEEDVGTAQQEEDVDEAQQEEDVSAAKQEEDVDAAKQEEDVNAAKQEDVEVAKQEEDGNAAKQEDVDVAKREEDVDAAKQEDIGVAKQEEDDDAAKQADVDVAKQEEEDNAAKQKALTARELHDEEGTDAGREEDISTTQDDWEERMAAAQSVDMSRARKEAETNHFHSV